MPFLALACTPRELLASPSSGNLASNALCTSYITGEVQISSFQRGASFSSQLTAGVSRYLTPWLLVEVHEEGNGTILWGVCVG